MDKLDSLSDTQNDNLKAWCLNRQTTGFNGRINKPSDSCYSFWIGSTLKVFFFKTFCSFLFIKSIELVFIYKDIRLT